MVLSDLTAFQRDVLHIIENMDEPHGLGIKETAEAELDVSEIHHGRLYPNLDELVEKGLVNKGSKDRRTNSYEISARGKRELDRYREWLNQDSF